MQVLSVLMFAVSCNFDNLAVGFSYGARKIHIPMLTSFIIGGITFAGTALSMAAGKLLSPLLPEELARFAGSGVILLIGVYAMTAFAVKQRRSDTSKDISPQWNILPPGRDLRPGEGAVLGMALALNNIGVGIGASISGIGIVPACAASLIIGALFLAAGNLAGKRLFSNWMGEYAEPLAAIMMIALGIYELFA